jgi:hypothetical protein
VQGFCHRRYHRIELLEFLSLRRSLKRDPITQQKRPAAGMIQAAGRRKFKDCGGMP